MMVALQASPLLVSVWCTDQLPPKRSNELARPVDNTDLVDGSARCFEVE